MRTQKKNNTGQNCHQARQYQCKEIPVFFFFDRDTESTLSLGSFFSERRVCTYARSASSFGGIVRDIIEKRRDLYFFSYRGLWAKLKNDGVSCPRLSVIAAVFAFAECLVCA
uniref:(northern house mosquito) hypothetical protein n=1 Tax=Culex pipiens TaxID=7175 RepID=A0A8D8AGB4_CULPI